MALKISRICQVVFSVSSYSLADCWYTQISWLVLHFLLILSFTMINFLRTFINFENKSNWQIVHGNIFSINFPRNAIDAYLNILSTNICTHLRSSVLMEIIHCYQERKNKISTKHTWLETINSLIVPLNVCIQWQTVNGKTLLKGTCKCLLL